MATHRAPSQDCVDVQADLCLSCPYEESLGPWLPIETPSQDSDQTVWMCRLTCVLAVCMKNHLDRATHRTACTRQSDQTWLGALDAMVPIILHTDS